MERFWRDKVVVITGASSGIGRDLALLLAGWGSKLVLVARRAELLEEVRAGCEAAGAEALAIPADVTDEAAMVAVRDRVLDRFGFADVVVANAGVGGLNPGTAFDLAIHRRFVEINVMGLANTLVPFIPSMLEKGRGHLVGVSSLAAFRGLPNAASYSSTKAQQAVFLESLRVDLRPRGIHVTCVHPGFVKTPMTAHDDFRMPFMVDVRKSSRIIARAIAKGQAVLLYPWQMRVVTWLNRSLPARLYDFIVPRVSGQSDKMVAKMF